LVHERNGDRVPGSRARRYDGEFTEFVRSSAGRLVRTGYVLLGDLGSAEDLAQETLSKVARRWQRVRQMENPRAYASRILVNLALDELARRRRFSEVLCDVPDLVVADGTSDIAGDQVVADVIAQLPPRQRATLVLRYWQDLSEAEIAAILGCSVGTVKSQTSKALAKVRQLLASGDTRVIPSAQAGIERTAP
jgi:RNA polymerase sigma-70 factor (sigma-E family)